MLQEVYERLYRVYGPQHWWPGETAFEVLVGAVLVQNTAWKNVEKAIGNLREEGLLDPRRLLATEDEELAELIRSAGYYRMKTRRLKNLLRMLVERFDGSLEMMFAEPLEELRAKLLAVNGIGPETADSILLYAGNLPKFVVDAYTYRVFARHGWIDFGTDYHELQAHFESGLERDAVLYNEYHALLVRVGHLHCRKTPKCDGCPLAELLPEGGPLEPDFF
jgi:endonuclease-3 related protein